MTVTIPIQREQSLKLAEVEKYDALHDTSLVHDLTLVLHTLVDADYVGQFLYDCRVYGLRSAKCYLLDYVSSKYGHDQHKAETEFHKVYDDIVNRF